MGCWEGVQRGVRVWRRRRIAESDDSLFEGIAQLPPVSLDIATRRLEDEVKSSLHQCIGSRLCAFGREATDHDCFRAEPASFDFSQDFNAVHVRHLHIERQQIGFQLLDLLQCLNSIVGRADNGDICHVPQHVVDRLPVQGGIVNDQDSRRARFHRSLS